MAGYRIALYAVRTFIIKVRASFLPLLPCHVIRQPIHWLERASLMRTDQAALWFLVAPLTAS